jgi:GGDEF domain-containing protein
MTESTLIHALADTARLLAAPDAGLETLQKALMDVSQRTGVQITVADDGGLAFGWPDDEGDKELRAAFEQGLIQLVNLAKGAFGRPGGILDRDGFLHELERCASAARWRDKQLALCVFEVEGMTLGPGIDETPLVERVGSAARESVRSADLVGHLGAGRFALLFPRAGTFEARAAFRRVRDALVGVEHEGSGLVCGQAGYAELSEDGSGDLLCEALTRLQTARTRHAYTGPMGPSSPTQPLAG